MIYRLRLLLIAFFTFNFLLFSFSQGGANDHTKWKTSVIQQKGSNKAKLVIQATVDADWHGYSIYPAAPNDGPLPTEFTFEESANYTLEGDMSEKGMKKAFDEVFELDILEFYPSATWQQNIQVKSEDDFILKTSVFYQICKEGMCIMDTKNLVFQVKGTGATTPVSSEINEEDQSNIEQVDEEGTNEVLSESELEWEYVLTQLDKKGNYSLVVTPLLPNGLRLLAMPMTEMFVFRDQNGVSFDGFNVRAGTKTTAGYFSENPSFRTNLTYNGDEEPVIPIEVNYKWEIDGEQFEGITSMLINFSDANLFVEEGCVPKKFDGENEKAGFSYWDLMIEAFLWGIASLLTPCVFPMIPMTVTFFLKGAEENSRAAGIRKATGYGLSIIGIYTLIGTIVAVTLGAAFANWLATHWLPNVLFFLIFIFFAASFLGMFEIRLPSWMINKSDAQADKGGFLGTFFMALTLVLVSFSCTGPIVGIILIKASQGAVIEPMLGMFAFSLAFALPFTLFAIFPSWLSKLPQSGGWLNTVKVVLGFLEIALGLKFLSVADQTYHWGLLDREVYIGLWIVIFGLMGMYLLGKLKFAHDSDLPYLRVPRFFMALCTFAFVVYLIPGLIGHPLKALSGYLPPMSSHDFDLLGEIRGVDENQCGDEPKYSDFLHIPHGISGYFDYEEALSCARAQNKPLFIDFTGHGCVNCREMEAKVWSDPAVLKMLKEDFVVVAIYVDDKTMLPESEWVTSQVDGKVKKTIGDINLDFQICHFGESAQPLYATLNSQEELVANPVGYVPLNEFKEFLERSLVEFNRQQKGVSPI